MRIYARHFPRDAPGNLPGRQVTCTVDQGRFAFEFLCDTPEEYAYATAFVRAFIRTLGGPEIQKTQRITITHLN